MNSNESGEFWVEPGVQYLIENTVSFPPPYSSFQSSSRIIFYGELDPKFSPNIYEKQVSSHETNVFVEGIGLDIPYVDNTWELYYTDLLQEEPTNPPVAVYSGTNNEFCFNLSTYSTSDYYFIRHVVSVPNQYCIPEEERYMFITINRIGTEPEKPICEFP